MNTLLTIVHAITVPNPTPQAPPGSGGFLLILAWGGWIVFGIAVIAMLWAAGRLMMDGQKGRGGGEAAQGVMFVLIGAIIAAVASGLIAGVATAASGGLA